MQTATNPQTGEKVQWNGSAWVPLGGAPAPAPQPSMPMSQPGVTVVGTPRPKPPETRTVGDQFGVVNPDGTFTPTYTAPAKPDKDAPDPQKEALAQAIKGLGIDELLTGVSRARGKVGTGWATGIPGAIGGIVPGSTRNDFLGLLDQIQGGLIMEKLQALKDASKTGASGMGALSEREGARLAAAVAALSPDMSAAEIERSLDEIERHATTLKAIGDGRNPDEVGGGQLGPEEVREELTRRIQGREDPQETIAWLISQGVTPSKEDIAAIIANQGNPNPQVSVDRVSPNADAFAAGLGDVAEFAGDALGLIGNPLNAGINAVAGTNLSTDLGQTFRDATGLPQGNPMASAINQGGLAALSGVGLARGVSSVAPKLAPYLSPLTPEPIRQGIAGAGAGAGTETARQNNLGPVGQVGAGVLSGLAGYGGANALMRLAQPKTASPLMQAAREQGIPLRPADVGGSAAKRVDSAALQSPLSAGPVIKSAKATQEGIEGATRRAARSQGDALDIDDAGEAIRSAGQSYSRNQAQRIGRVYDRAESRAKGVKIKPQGSLAFLDEQIARFRQAPQGESIVKELQSVRDSIAGGVSVSGMRDARTILSQGVYDGKLRSGMEKGLYKQFLGLLSKDIEAGLSAAGRKDSLNLFRVADKAWSDRIEYIDNVLEPVIGPKKSGEQVLEAVERMAGAKGGNAKRLTELLRELPPEQTGNIRATIIERLGKAPAGQQNDTGDVFAASSFMTNWNRMSAKGKAVLFGNGELRQNLDQIAKVANAAKETGRAANHSNTGTALNVAGLTGVGAYAPKTAITVGIVQLATGRLMASPAFTRWLARVPANPQAMERHAGQLEQIAVREPLIANDIASIQQYLGSAAQRAAAGSENQAENRR